MDEKYLKALAEVAKKEKKVYEFLSKYVHDSELRDKAFILVGAIEAPAPEPTPE